MSTHSKPVTAPSHASFDYCPDAEPMTNVAYVDAAATELKRGTPGGNLESRQPAQRIGQLFREPIAEVLLVLPRTQVRERQDGCGLEPDVSCAGPALKY